MTVKNKRKKIENWLVKNKKTINITGFEKSINAPKGLIQKFIKYDVPINDKHIDAIYDSIHSHTRFSIR